MLSMTPVKFRNYFLTIDLSLSNIKCRVVLDGGVEDD